MLAAGGVAAYAMPGTATAQPRSPFSVSPTFIPIAGSSELFPVRRIYCIGRNYAAQSAGDGFGPPRRAAVLFPEAARRGAERADQHDGRSPLPAADQKLSLRD